MMPVNYLCKDILSLKDIYVFEKNVVKVPSSPTKLPNREGFSDVLVLWEEYCAKKILINSVLFWSSVNCD